MIYTKTAVDSGDDTVATEESDSLVNNMIGGLRLPVLGKDELADSSSAFWGTVLYSVGSSAASSYMARRRQAAGSEPIAGVFL